MKITFEKFTQLFLESILDEDKSKMIDKLVLPDIKDEEEKEKFKKQLKSYFNTYSAFEKFIDWNKWKTLTKSDFDEVLAKADQSNKAKKEKERQSIGIDPKSLFKNIEGRKFKILGETTHWLFVAPLNYEAAYFCNAQECGGAPAKWCIGYEDSNMYWNQYIREGSKFIMAFSKDFDTMPEKELYTNLKYMIQDNEDSDLVVWNQLDKTIDTDEAFSRYLNFLNDNFIYSMFMDLSYRDYEITELDDEGFVVSINIKRIKDRTYYPPEEAVGLDFSYISPTLVDAYGIDHVFIPKTIKTISSDCFKKWILDSVIFENGRSDYLNLSSYAFAFSKIKKLQLPNRMSIGSRILAYANVDTLVLPETFTSLGVEVKSDIDIKTLSRELGTNLENTEIIIK